MGVLDSARDRSKTAKNAPFQHTSSKRRGVPKSSPTSESAKRISLVSGKYGHKHGKGASLVVDEGQFKKFAGKGRGDSLSKSGKSGQGEEDIEEEESNTLVSYESMKYNQELLHPR